MIFVRGHQLKKKLYSHEDSKFFLSLKKISESHDKN